MLLTDNSISQEEVVAAPVPEQEPARVPQQEPARVSEEEDGPICIICQDTMARPQDNLALFCGHVFHRLCVLEWRVCANKTEMDCPLRCRPEGDDPAAP